MDYFVAGVIAIFLIGLLALLEGIRERLTQILAELYKLNHMTGKLTVNSAMQEYRYRVFGNQGGGKLNEKN